MRDLSGFRAWLITRGRSTNTADAYVGGVKRALEAKTITARLLERGLAPKSKRVILASIRAYALYRGDAKLTAALKDIKLPTASRVTVKRPLEFADWQRLCAAIDGDDKLRPPVRAVLGLLANRGFRCGDVLRMKRAQIEKALATGDLVFRAKGGRWLRYTTGASVRPYLELLVGKDNGRWLQVADLVSRHSKPARRHKEAVATCNAALRRVAATVGLAPADVHSHRLRRTYSVHFLRSMAGDPEAMQKLQAQMQWASPATAFEYTDYVNRGQLDKLDENLAKRRRGAK
jgi:site-specific recombinase XerC